MTDLRYGPCGPDAPEVDFVVGPLRLAFAAGDLIAIRWHGVEVVRRIAMPVRDVDWSTLPTVTTAFEHDVGPQHATLTHRFHAGPLLGELTATAQVGGDAATIDVALRLEAEVPFLTNRAGFVLLHPVDRVAGQPLTVDHPDGTSEHLRFPDLILPGQPAFDIAGLRHDVDGVSVRIAMEGEVFEMEDQRNWTDASYKTYCRPLALPRPYPLEPGTPVRQALRIELSGKPVTRSHLQTATSRARMPELRLAVEGGEAAADSIARAVARTGITGVTARVRSDIGAEALAALAGCDALEIVLPEGAEPSRASAALVAPAAEVGLASRWVMALPEAYLTSHQPGGPWPVPSPGDLVAPLHAAFPAARVGSGSLTNFTEFNRCPPDPRHLEFVGFGTTAIVHAADDRSVVETLGALPHVFRTARALAGDLPLRLGLMSIGMRSNPYGAGVASNPEGARVAMAMDDPRQQGLFAAAFAVGLVARAAVGEVESLCLAMVDGPLGLGLEQGAGWPIAELCRHLNGIAAQEVTITDSDGLVTVANEQVGICANLALAPRPCNIPAGWTARHLLGDAADDSDLLPFDVILLSRGPA